MVMGESGRQDSRFQLNKTTPKLDEPYTPTEEDSYLVAKKKD
jgi:hypothetical protein